MKKPSKCICAGNWRAIVSENESMIGRKYKDNRGKVHRFFGLVHGDDDYYYGMSSRTGVVLLSCVGDITGHGFELLPENA